MMQELFSLKGRRAVITGASRGLGRSIALGYAEAGADLVLIARTEEPLVALATELEAKGTRVMVLPVDVTDSRAVADAFGRVQADWGGLDILVNNAGTNVRKSLVETEDEDWQKVMRTNLDSAFFCAREAAKCMIPAGQGRIVMIGSVAGITAIPTGVAYAATKAGLSQMCKVLAQELGPHGITANCIAPWYFRTPLTEALLDDPAYLKRILKVTPLGRTGEAKDLQGVAIFLASDASAYVTGQTLAVDGGMSTSTFALP